MSNPFEILERKLINIECMLMEGKNTNCDLKTPELEIITGEELCKKLDVTIQTLIRWRHKGKIPYLQLGSSIRYDFNKVLDALEVTKKRGGAKL